MKQYKRLIKKNIGKIAGVALLSILTSFAMVFAGYSLSFLYTAYEYEGDKVKALLTHSESLLLSGCWQCCSIMFPCLRNQKFNRNLKMSFAVWSVIKSDR